MSDKPHEVLDLSSLRASAPKPKEGPVDAALRRVQGKSFKQLSPSEKDDLLMILGVKLGILTPENDEH